MRAATRIASGLAACLLGACASASADVGYLAPVSGDKGYDKWVVELRASAGGLVRGGVAARSKLGEKHDQIAIAPELAIEMSPGPLTLGARLGVQLLQIDNENGDWTVGWGTPYFQPILQYRIGEPVFIFLGGMLEYELNSGKENDQLYLGAQLGVGIDL